ncbi:hypothetical protein SAMN06265365_102328 [Tistlia consotensis]|uniref:Uncharacterized protein n=1 Tax=Tistlia consotensis USBA 355 TaxID=560819 RepID=A0A1Y6C884_9PROT|nr:hypothetical protein [Tistlia consotensis]SMF39418.1 hypothetical protein SAMN05428998_113135 [Tistlia consotensis USBA 355]SNR36400.1 hypothetical protein SAMN06265365_102328 [Tistlia consotensis]
MLSDEEKSWVREWAPKIFGTAYLLCIMAMMGAHPRPGSLDSIRTALVAGLPWALGLGALGTVGALLWRRRA